MEVMMEWVLRIWEKSETIGLTIFFAIISMLVSWYAYYQKSLIPLPNDHLTGTLITPSYWLMEGMWYLTLAMFVLYLVRYILARIF